MGTKDVTINMMIEEGDVLGATPSENLVITRVQNDTLADGKIFVNDKIIKVNNVEPRDVHHFYRLVVAASRKGHLELVVRRGKQDTAKDAQEAVPQDRLSKLRIRDGFAYRVVEMEFKRGMKVGLGFKEYMNCVVVTRAQEGTMAGGVFKVGDTICDVDNTRVSDKGVCQTLIVNALKAHQKVSCVVASPESEEAKKWVAESLSAQAQPAAPQASAPTDRTAGLMAPESQPTPEETPSAIVCRDPPSIRVKSDVRRIAMEEIERRRKTKDQPLQGIMRTNAKDAKRVSIKDGHDEHLIANENPNAPLRPVK